MNPLLPIITGYAAKNLSSGIFVAGRSQESVEASDLNFSFIKYAKNHIDFDKKEVSSRFLWHKSKAIYIEGYGCSLVHDATVNEIKNRPYQQVEIIPQNPDTIAWPMGDVITDTIPMGINMEKLQHALNMAFADTMPHKGTFAVAVVYKGQMVAERYKEGFSSENKFLSWSMGKSFINTWVGIMAKQGKIDINTPVNFEAWQNDSRKEITWNNLLHMNSGLEWNENYGSNSDVNIMLHKVGNMGKYALEKPQEFPADSIWSYSSGTTNIVTLAIRNLCNDDATYYTFLRNELFNKIGMRSAIFEVDASGTFVGSSYLYATMRDFARFGLLYLNNGNWLGTQILPENWVEYTTTEAKGSDGKYGAFFWLNKNKANYPDVPEDMYSCQGHDGQFIYIIPSKDLVVVRTGFSKKGWFDRNEFLSGIIKAIN
jgi:CubicO group peptidase (beta-lactamase class C family)